MRLILGTRGSALATTQSELVAHALREAGHEVELRIVRTSGDRTRESLTQVAGLGVFAVELRAAVLAGECDLAVHSCKDLPVAPVDGLTIAAVPPREDPRDALCSRDGLTLAELPAGARIGTGSPRRIAQLRALRPDCDFVDIRGNVGTRLGRLEPGDLDAVVLAAAGLSRLGLSDTVTELLTILPAPAQGALAVECRADNAAVREALSVLDDPMTRTAIDAERALLAALGGGCAAPIGALGHEDDGELRLTAGVFSADGQQACVDSVSTRDSAGAAGTALATRLIEAGAARITPLDASRPSRLAEFHDDVSLWERPLDGMRILLPREDGRLSAALESAGAAVRCEPILRRRTLDPRLTRLPAADWTVITSARTAETLDELGWAIPESSRIAAVGPATARALRHFGYEAELIPSGGSTAEDLLAEFPSGHGTVALPASQLARPTLAEGLRDLGWDVTPIPVYTMEPVPPSPELTRAWRDGEFDAVIVTAGSIARAVDRLLGWPTGVRIVAFGPPSAAVLTDLSVSCTIATSQDAAGVIAALTTHEETS